MDNEKQTENFNPDEYLQQIKQHRRQLRLQIRDIMQEVTGQTYAIEDKLHQIMKALSKEQQKLINDKLRLAMLLQEPPKTP
jgi:uncharacterized protein YaaN involved in tellurite resistance